MHIIVKAPWLLDLGCKAGGCSAGYKAAGFKVRGVDIEPQPNYPFDFIQADALTVDLDGYDAYHASMPCQAHSHGKRLAQARGIFKDHPDLIAPMRERLLGTGKPYIMENVPEAPLISPVIVCGSYFGLRVTKERAFESNVPLVGAPCRHVGKVKKRNLPDDSDGYYWRAYGHERNVEIWKAAMGVNWMTREEAANAIPPIFTEYLGRQLLKILQSNFVITPRLYYQGMIELP